jgi:hypothetical protein
MTSFAAVGVADVADLVGVAEKGGGAVEQGGLGVGAGGHHRALDVDVRVDEAGGEDGAGGVEVGDARGGAGGEVFFGGAGGFGAGDAAGFDPEFAVGVEAVGVGGEEAGAGDDEVGCGAPHGHGGELAGEFVEGRDGETGERHGRVRRRVRGREPTGFSRPRAMKRDRGAGARGKWERGGGAFVADSGEAQALSLKQTGALLTPSG